MGYLRLVHSALPQPAPESTCLAAYDQELDYLFETLRRLGVAPREIEDLAQEVFVVLHRNWPTLDTSRPLRPYLFGVAFRVAHAHRRRHRREVPAPGLDIEDGGSSPDDLLQSKQSIALLLAGLERVPLRRRAVLILHELEGVPINDVAKRLSISRFGAYARLRKARRELAKAVGHLLKNGARQ